MIFGFAIALLVGVTIGTYSSIYVASTSLLALGVTKEDVAIPVKEGEDQEALTPKSASTMWIGVSGSQQLVV